MDEPTAQPITAERHETWRIVADFGTQTSSPTFRLEIYRVKLSTLPDGETIEQRDFNPIVKTEAALSDPALQAIYEQMKTLADQWAEESGQAHDAPPQPAQNYLGFYQGLLSENLNLFLFVRSIADLNLPVSNAYTDLMGAIMFQQFAGFQSSITILFASLQGAGYGFSEAQVAQMRSLLDQYGFSAIEFPLGQ